jgi:hypothetical protein
MPDGRLLVRGSGAPGPVVLLAIDPDGQLSR